MLAMQAGSHMHPDKMHSIIPKAPPSKLAKSAPEGRDMEPGDTESVSLPTADELAAEQVSERMMGACCCSGQCGWDVRSAAGAATAGAGAACTHEFSMRCVGRVAVLVSCCLLCRCY